MACRHPAGLFLYLRKKQLPDSGGWKGRSYPSLHIMQLAKTQALSGLRFLVLL
jgi:hypothetical protein